MKRKLTLGVVFAIVLMLAALTAVAVGLLTGKQVIEQVAVPLALNNDEGDTITDVYSSEELEQVLAALKENGIELDENSGILQAIANGQDYWEEETLMEICREAFGGLFYEWSVEEKYWFDAMAVQIGFKEHNMYLVPGEGDMTVDEARAYGAQALEMAYGVQLPAQSDAAWRIYEYFYAPYTDETGQHDAQWQFEYENSETGVCEYTVQFDRKGENVQTWESELHGTVTQVGSFDQARMYVGSKYGGQRDWPPEAWAQYGSLIAPLEPQSRAQWCEQHAQYRAWPQDGLTREQAVECAKEAVNLDGQMDTHAFYFEQTGRMMAKVVLSIHFPGNENSASYDAIWCVEMDAMTGEISEMREYRYAQSDMLMMYVPFAVLDAAPQDEDFPTGE